MTTFNFINTGKILNTEVFVVNKNSKAPTLSFVKTKKTKNNFLTNFNTDEGSLDILEKQIIESLSYHREFLNSNLPQQVDIEIVRENKTEQLEHYLRKDNKFFFKTIRKINMGFSLKLSDRKYKDTNPEDLVFENQNKEEIVQEKKEKEFNPWDYVRVVNVRGEPDYQANPDEKVIIGHRANPILGNRHVMQEKSIKERDRVIAEYKKDLEADLAVKGPIWQTLQGIAKEIAEKQQKFAISCHCSPIKCHNDLVIPVVVNMVEDLLKNTLFNKEITASQPRKPKA